MLKFPNASFDAEFFKKLIKVIHRIYIYYYFKLRKRVYTDLLETVAVTEGIYLNSSLPVLPLILNDIELSGEKT